MITTRCPSVPVISSTRNASPNGNCMHRILHRSFRAGHRLDIRWHYSPPLALAIAYGALDRLSPILRNVQCDYFQFRRTEFLHEMCELGIDPVFWPEVGVN